MGYLQFVLRDAEADTGLLDVETWRESPEEWRIGVEEHAPWPRLAMTTLCRCSLSFWLMLLPPCHARKLATTGVVPGEQCEQRAGGPRPRHHHRRLCRIAGLCMYAVEDEFLDHSPAAHVRRPSC